MTKRNLIIIVVVLTVIAIGIGVYFAWKNSQPDEPETGNNNNQNGNTIINQNNNNKFAIVSNKEVLTYSFSTSSIFYLTKEGQIMKNESEKEENLATIEHFDLNNFISAQFSSDNKLLLINSKPNNLDIYNIEKKYWNNSFSGIEAAILLNDNKTLFGTFVNDNGQRELLSKDISKDLSSFIKLATLNFLDFTLQAPQKDKFYFIPKPNSNVTSDAWLFDAKTKKFSRFLSEVGLIMNWSKFGDMALKFSINSNNPILGLIDVNGNNIVNFRFITFPDKCFITSPKQLYCAIPQDQAGLANLSLPEDYLMRKANFVDGIYQVDINEQKVNPIYEGSDPAINATNISVLDNYLYFINRYDNKLYRLSL